MLVPEAHGAHKACDIYTHTHAINDVAIISIRIFVCIRVCVCIFACTFIARLEPLLIGPSHVTPCIVM